MENEKIECPVCSGKANSFTVETKLLDGRVVLREDRFYKCGKCEEEFSTAEQMREAERQLRETHRTKAGSFI